MNMIDEKAVPQQSTTENQEEQDNGFIDFHYHSVYITEPPRINSSVINPSEAVRYLGLHDTRSIGDQLGQVMQGLLLFHEKQCITIPPLKDMLECTTARLFFNYEKGLNDLGDLFFSHYRNHYDFIQGLAYLGTLLKEDGFTGESEKAELTYKDDLKYIVAFVAYAYELASYPLDENHDDPKYHKALPSDEVVETVRVIIERVTEFRKQYEHDNATIPFGDEGGLKTNVARFMYKYYLPMFYNIKDEDLTDKEREVKQQQFILYHRDTERDVRNFMGTFKGFYSVVYNPLLNKLFVWDYSKYHMKDL